MRLLALTPTLSQGERKLYFPLPLGEGLRVRENYR